MQYAIINVNALGTIAFVNEHILALLSKSMLELVGKHWTVVLDSVLPPFHHEIVAAMGAAQTLPATTGFSREGACRLYGELLDVLWTVSRLEGVGVQTALIFSESQNSKCDIPVFDALTSYKDTFDHAVEGIFRTTLDGFYLEANPALARLYGYDSPASLIAAMSDLSTQLYVQPGTRTAFVELMQKQASVSDFEAEVYRADGSIIWIAEFARTVYDKAGSPVFYEGSVIDITHKKRSEQAIRESEEKFRLLVETTNVLPWEAEIDTWQFTYVGPQAVHFLGFPQEEWLKEGFWERQIHEEDRAWVPMVRAEAVANRKKFECEYRMLASDGRIVWVRDVLGVIELRNNRQILGGFTFDITYRHFTEQALRENRHYVEHIAGGIPAVVYLYDVPSEECLFVSGRVDRILGYSQRALWDMKPFFIWALAHDSEEPIHREHLQKVSQLGVGQMAEREFRLRSAAGHWVWLQSRETVFVRNPSGDPQQILGIAFDVTSQHLAHEELASNEALFRSLSETTKVIPFEMDLETGRFTYVGPQSESLLGYPAPHWFRREGWVSLIHPEDQEIAMQFMYPPATHPGPEADFQAEFRLRTAKGDDLWVRELVRYVRGEDQRLRARGFLFDITEAKIYEEELTRARDRLRELAFRDQNVREDERANVAREIHDELGQALTLFRIDLGWMEKRLTLTPIQEIAPLIEKTNQMNKLIDGTLQTVRRIISNLRPAVLDELGLKAAIEWQAEEFSRRAGIRCLVVSDLGENVANDTAIALFRIFQELLTNVLRHAYATRVDVRVTCVHPHLELCVRDNGRGFSPAELGSKKSFGLLGMRERAQALGGGVEIEAEIGKGTCVTVSLPLQFKAD